MIKDIYEILKFHGIIKGLIRSKDYISQNVLFDIKHNVKTTKIKLVKSLLIHPKDKWYQPCYYTPVINAFSFLNKLVELKNYEVGFLDLGCGKGKPSIIFSKLKFSFTNYGFDIDYDLKNEFISNNLKFNKNNFFINEDINNIDFNKYKKELMIIFYMNTLNPDSLLKLIEKLKKVDTKYKFFIYSNPEFHKILTNYDLIYSEKKGWHKSWGINIYSLD